MVQFTKGNSIGGIYMTGKELVEWIEENHAEEHTLIAVTQDHRYLRVKDVWEGETDGHAIMMNVAEDAAHD